jgi:hypothetical protein
LLIYISFEVGLTNDDIDTFKKFLDLFGHKGKNKTKKGIKIGIVITRSESRNKTSKENLIGQLKNQSYFSELLKLDNVKVLFMGCVDLNNTTITAIKDIKKLYITVYNMRKELLDFIFSSYDKTIKLLELPISIKMKTDSNNLLSAQKSILESLELAKDFDDQESQMSIYKFNENVDKILELSAVLYDEAINFQFNEMIKRMNPLIPKFKQNHDLKKTFY